MTSLRTFAAIAPRQDWRSSPMKRGTLRLGLAWSDCEIDRELIRGTSATAHSFLEKEYHRRLKELENA
jgi:hypothetical protein